MPLEWPGPEVKKERVPDYEMAYMKAYLEDASNERAGNVFSAMFGHDPKKGLPYWMVRLCIYYGALSIGYGRKRLEMPGSERSMLRCLMQFDENALRSNKILWHKMYLHDVEDAKFGGRELVG